MVLKHDGWFLELGDHIGANNKKLRLSCFCVFHIFLQIHEDLRYETSYTTVNNFYENIECDSEYELEGHKSAEISK